MTRRGMRAVLGGVALLAATVVAGPAHAVDRDAVAQRIATEYGVEVLKVVDGTLEDGTPVFLVTVMSPGGNSNSAFMVSTLAVHPDTGELVPQFRHRPSGYDTGGPASRVQGESFGPALRRDSRQAR